ncbi:MAG: SDR family oxidoreductase [Pseudomonadota bacterium]
MDTTHLFSLDGRTALVTGGSRNIGKIIAEAFLEQGAKVYITSRKAPDCEKTAEELGPKCIALPQDVSSLEGVHALAKQLETLEDELDILVNNAGAAWAEPFDSFSEHGWDKVIDLNLKTPFFLSQALHSMLSAGAKRGHLAKIINIASIDGLRLNPLDTYSYHASKSGLIFLTKKMAARLVDDGIVVSAIAPGAFASEMNRAARDHEAEVAKEIPLKRIGTAQDMAGAAIFLASRAGDYVVGDTITLDGGLTHGQYANSHVL